MAIDFEGVELVILPFFIPLILIGRFIDVWKSWRGEPQDSLEPSSDRQWAQTWGRMLSGESPEHPPARRT